MADLVCSAFSDNSSATCDASGSAALKKRKFRKKIPSFGFFQNGKLETRGPLPEKIAQQKAAARSVLERKSGVLRGRIEGILRRSRRVGGGLIFGSGAFFGCGRVQALALGIHIGHELVAGDGLLLKKIESDLVEKFAVLAQNLLGFFVAALEQLLNFGICGEGSLVGAVHHSAAVEILARDGGKRHEAELLAHAVLRDHLAGKIGSALNVVRCAGRCDAEDDLLGCASAEECLQLDKQLYDLTKEVKRLREELEELRDKRN